MKKILSLTILAVALSGCSDSSKNKDKPTPLTEGSYVIQTIAADYGSASVVTGDILGDRAVKNTILASDNSDVSISTNKNFLYRLNKQDGEVSKIDASTDLSTSLWTKSVNSDGEAISASPYSIAHLSDTKAYVVRYGSKDIWEINDKGEKQANIDLSAYSAGYTAANEQTPNATDAVIYQDKLFVVMQRLDATYTSQGSYVAVIDTANNSEVNTGKGDNNLKGIKLNADNAWDSALHNGYLYVAGRGDFDSNAGALDKIDLTTYEVTKLADGSIFASLNNTDNGEKVHIQDVAIVDNNNGYVLVRSETFYAMSGSSYIFSFNPSTGVIADQPLNINAINGKLVSDITTDPNGKLWIAIADAEDPKVLVYDTDTNTQSGDAIEMDMPPQKIEFLTVQ